MSSEKSKIIGSTPVLMVYDIVSTAHFYRDKLGFHFNRFWGEPPGFCILHRDEFSVMLNKISDEQHLAPNDNICKYFGTFIFGRIK